MRMVHGAAAPLVQVRVPGSELDVHEKEPPVHPPSNASSVPWLATPVHGPLAVPRLMLTEQPWAGSET
jgi:hypothetical protein